MSLRREAQIDQEVAEVMAELARRFGATANETVEDIVERAAVFGDPVALVMSEVPPDGLTELEFKEHTLRRLREAKTVWREADQYQN